jgi:hypothetical protein
MRMGMTSDTYGPCQIYKAAYAPTPGF